MPLNYYNTNNFITVSQSSSINGIYNISQNAIWGTVEKVPSTIDAIVVGNSVLFNSENSVIIKDEGNDYFIINSNDILLIEADPLW